MKQINLFTGGKLVESFLVERVSYGDGTLKFWTDTGKTIIWSGDFMIADEHIRVIQQPEFHYRMRIHENFFISCVDRPNLWWRFWIKLFFGFTWEKIS